MSENKNKKKRPRWSPFSRLFKRTAKPPEVSGTNHKPGVETGFEDGFVIEDSDEDVIEIEESTTDIFIPESALKEYTVLGLDEDVSDTELKRKYRLLVKENHPDNGGDPKEFMRIQKAYKKIMKYRRSN